MKTSTDIDPRPRQLLLRLPEAARALGIARSTLYQLLAAGELPTIHIGRAVRIPAEALDEFIARRAATDDTQRRGGS